MDGDAKGGGVVFSRSAYLVCASLILREMTMVRLNPCAMRSAAALHMVLHKEVQQQAQVAAGAGGGAPGPAGAAEGAGRQLGFATYPRPDELCLYAIG